MLNKFILTILILLSPTLWAAKAPAEEFEFRSGKTIIQIVNKECDNKVILDQLKPEYHKQFRKAVVLDEGKPTKGCWTMDAQGVFIILENGGQGYIPPELFKPVETI